MDEKSLAKLKAEATHNMQKFIIELDKRIPLRVNEVLRDISRQKKLVESGASRTMNSRHLPNEDGKSEAVDAYPLPIPNFSTATKDEIKKYNQLCYKMGEEGKKISEELNIPIRYGGDWDGDGIYTDQKFNDLVHFEEDLPS